MTTPAMEQLLRQRDLEQQLAQLQPTLAHLYDHCLQMLPRYDERMPDARANISFLAHGVREMLNSIPNALNANTDLSRSQEAKALDALKKALKSCGPISIPQDSIEETDVPLSAALALQEYQQELAKGHNNARNRMATVFLGSSNTSGGSLDAVRSAERFFMQWVHVDRTMKSSPPSRSRVLREFEIIETSLLARLGDFFSSKERLLEFVNNANRRDEDGSFAEPDDDEVRYGLSLTADPNLAPLFFGRLENPNWMKKLAAHKAFTDLSTPETTGNWREYSYIVRMAPIVPEDVCSALATAGEHTSRFVKGAVLECAAQMPSDSAVTLVDKLLLWTGDEAMHEDWLWQQEYLSRLFAILLSDPKTAKRGRKLLQALFRPRPSSKPLQGRPYYGHFAALIPSGEYVESLSDAMRWLPMRIQIGVLSGFLQEIDAVRSFDEHVRTSIYIPSIDQAVHDNSYNIAKQLAKTICHPLRALLDSNDIAFEKNLLDHSRHVVQRAAMYVLTQAILESPGNEINKLFTLASKVFRLPDILDGDYDPELFPLVRVAKRRDPGLPLDGLLSGLEDGARRRANRFLDNAERQGATEEREAKREADRHGRKWKHRVLTLIGKESLTGDNLQMLVELDSEFGPCKYHERHISSVQCVWGSQSPISLVEMQNMQPDDLISYLRASHFQSKDLFDMRSHRGQGDVLSSLVHKRPALFEGMAEDIASLRPTYITAILSGWYRAMAESAFTDLKTGIEVCEKMADIPDGKPFPAEGNYMDDDDSYDFARREAIQLINAILSHCQPAELEPKRDRLLDISMAFLKSIQPVEIEKQSDDTTAPDPVQSSINGTRTIAIQALGRWIHTFAESPRKQEALEAIEPVLPTRSTNLSDAAALGIILPFLSTSARTWPSMHYHELLGSGHANAMQQVVLTTTLSLYRYNHHLFDFLRPAMLSALEDGCNNYILGCRQKDADCPQLIGMWVVHSLLTGHISYYDHIFSIWEKKASPGCQCDVLSRHCDGIRSLKPARLAPLIRAAHLWDRVYDRMASSNTADSLQESLYSLIKSSLLPNQWWAPRLESTFKLGATCIRLSLLKNELANLTVNNADNALSILSAAAESKTSTYPHYEFRSAAVPVIGNILQQGDSELEKRAREVMSKIGRMGITDLDTLVNEYVEQTAQNSDEGMLGTMEEA